MENKTNLEKNTSPAPPVEEARQGNGPEVAPAQPKPANDRRKAGGGSVNINYAKFVKSLENIGVDFSQMDAKYGELIKNAPATRSVDEGLSYPGSLVWFNGWKLTSWAMALNDKLPEDKRVKKEILLKTACLFQLAKSVIYVEEVEEWKRKKGYLYAFRDLDGALRCGERTVLMCMECGIPVSPVEYEALTIIDKLVVNDPLVTHVSPLATIIRAAYDMALAETQPLK